MYAIRSYYDLLTPGADGLADRPQARDVFRAGYRHPRRRRLTPVLVTDETLHDPVLERVKTDDRQTALPGENIGHLFKHRFV